MSRKAVFHYFLSDDIKQYASTTSEQIKRIIELFQKRAVFFSDMSTIWGNTGGCAEQYFCVAALYLLSMLEHAYNITIDCGVGAPVYGREVVDGLNATEKRFLSMLMINLQLSGAAAYESQVVMHNSIAKIDIVLARGFQNNLSDPA